MVSVQNERRLIRVTDGHHAWPGHQYRFWGFAFLELVLGLSVLVADCNMPLFSYARHIVKMCIQRTARQDYNLQNKVSRWIRQTRIVRGDTTRIKRIYAL